MPAGILKLSFSEYSRPGCILTYRDLARDHSTQTHIDPEAEFMVRVLPIPPPDPSASPKRSSGSKIDHGLAVLQTRWRDPRTGRDSYDRDAKVYVKWGFTEKRVAQLSREASIYMNELVPLQGDVTPMCYGFYTEKRKHAKMGCLVLQYCDNKLQEGMDRFEMFRLIMVKGCRLHGAGIQHNMLDMSKNISAADGDIRFLDFSSAQPHKCQGAHPQVGSKNPNSRKRPECKELKAMENLYGLQSGEKDNVYKELVIE